MRQISKQKWYDLGGFRNPSLFRKHNGRCWEYWQDTGHPSAEYSYRS